MLTRRYGWLVALLIATPVWADAQATRDLADPSLDSVPAEFEPCARRKDNSRRAANLRPSEGAVEPAAVSAAAAAGPRRKDVSQRQAQQHADDAPVAVVRPYRMASADAEPTANTQPKLDRNTASTDSLPADQRGIIGKSNGPRRKNR